MNLENKIDRLIKNIILLQGKTDQRQKLIETEHWKAKHTMDNAAGSLGNTAHRIEKLTADTVAGSIEKPLKEFERGVGQLGLKFSEIVQQAEKQQNETAKRIKIFQWTTFPALAAAAAVSIGSAVFMMKQARKEALGAEWIADVNNAVSKGTLVRCSSDGGVCAKIKGKTVRLDK